VAEVPGEIAGRVSRETAERLAIYAEELARWQRALNLVSAGSLGEIWTRHIDDCLQIAELEPSAPVWLDLGSGAGLPGLIAAAAQPGRQVTLVESDLKKCAFLRTTARRMGLDVDVQPTRIERFVAPADFRPDVVSARALAPLVKLLAYAQPFLHKGAHGLFPKGRSAGRELTEAQESWIFEVDIVPSRTDPEGRILRVRDFAGPRT
jgi:16S rRNA (guanine527-N7)-methyltransferase